MHMGNQAHSAFVEGKTRGRGGGCNNKGHPSHPAQQQEVKEEMENPVAEPEPPEME